MERGEIGDQRRIPCSHPSGVTNLLGEGEFKVELLLGSFQESAGDEERRLQLEAHALTAARAARQEVHHEPLQLAELGVQPPRVARQRFAPRCQICVLP